MSIIVERVLSTLKLAVDAYREYLSHILKLREEFLSICKGSVKLLVLAKSPPLRLSELMMFSSAREEERSKYVNYFYNYDYPDEHLRALTLDVASKHFGEVREAKTVRDKLVELSKKGIFVDYVVLAPIPPTLFNEVLNVFRGEVLQDLRVRVLEEINPSSILLLGNVQNMVETVTAKKISITQIRFPSRRKKDLHAEYAMRLDEVLSRIYGTVQ